MKATTEHDIQYGNILHGDKMSRTDIRSENTVPQSQLSTMWNITWHKHQLLVCVSVLRLVFSMQQQETNIKTKKKTTHTQHGISQL